MDTKLPTTDSAHDVRRRERQPLDAIFAPKAVAVIGATEAAGSVGRTVLWNLMSNPFGGTVFPVNPRHPGVLGIKAYPDIRSVPAKIRIVGPNCLGVMNPITGLNATFAAGMARPGNVAFISQSGALCTAVLDWSFKEQVGFSAFVSIGSKIGRASCRERV